MHNRVLFERPKGRTFSSFVTRVSMLKEMQDGVDEFVQYGTCFNKTKFVLQIQNEKNKNWCFFFVGVLLEMLKFKQFYPTPSWVVPFKNSSMKYLKLQSLWKCMMMPPSVELDNVARFFYEHMNPSSRLRKLRR
jgi:hypothetical protein